MLKSVHLCVVLVKNRLDSRNDLAHTLICTVGDTSSVVLCVIGQEYVAEFLKLN